MVLAPEKKKKLLRCPEKPLSHRAHPECGRWGRIRGRRTSITGTRGCNQQTHTEVTSSKPGTEHKPEVLTQPLCQLTQTPFVQSLSQQLLRLGSESLLPPPRLRAVTIIFQDSAVPRLSPRGAPPIQSTLPPQVQPKQLGSEGRKERAGNWFYSIHTHTYCHSKIPLPRQSFDMSLLTHNIPPVM